MFVGTHWKAASLAPGQHNTVSVSFINAMNYNGLFRICSMTLMPIPDLIDSWLAVSDTVFEFTLHEGILFHNGEILTARDIVASFDYVRNYPYTAHVREGIVYFEAIDDLTIRIDTVEPYALLLHDLAHVGNMIMPKSLIEAGHDFTFSAIGTGPFAFKEYRRGLFMRHMAFENYFDIERSAGLEYIIWKALPDPTHRGIALEISEIDFNVYVTLRDVARLKAHPDIEVRTLASTGHHKLILNNDNPKFSNPYVRRAIGMAIDKESAVLAGMSDMAFPTWASVPTVFQGGTNEGAYSFDPEAARSLLKKLGIDPATLSFTIVANSDERLRTGEVFRSNLADIGIDVTVTIFERGAQIDDFEATFDAFNSLTFLGYVRGVFLSDNIESGSNRGRFRNNDVDDLIRRALATVDNNTRVAIYYDISRAVNESVPHIPTHMAMIARAFNANLAVPEFPPTGALHLNMMYWRD